MQTQDLTKIGICVALLCVSAYISIPLPFTVVMLSALTLVVNLIAFLLTPRQAFTAMLVYVLIGAVGVPVFTGGAAGFGKLFGPTGGFILGFLISVPLMSLLKGKVASFRRYLLVAVFIGMPIIYACGAFSMCVVQDLSLMPTLIAAVFPFIPGDILKAAVSAWLGVKLRAVFAAQR